MSAGNVVCIRLKPRLISMNYLIQLQHCLYNKHCPGVYIRSFPGRSFGIWVVFTNFNPPMTRDQLNFTQVCRDYPGILWIETKIRFSSDSSFLGSYHLSRSWRVGHQWSLRSRFQSILRWPAVCPSCSKWLLSQCPYFAYWALFSSLSSK